MKRVKWVCQLPPHIKSELLRTAYFYLIGNGFTKSEALEVVDVVAREKIVNILDCECLQHYAKWCL